VRRLSTKAYAKVNPFLSVGPLRSDGYHEVRTILQAVSLYDTVLVEESPELSVTCSIPELSGEANLAYKALRLMAELVALPRVAISIEKRIPVEAGLGGGSSDAAATLRAVNLWLGGPLTEADLADIAAACGADCAFFIMGHPRAQATGRGEVVSPIPPPPQTPIVVAKPDIGCSTSEMYALLDAVPERQLSGFDGSANDFEAVAPSGSIEAMQRLQGLGAGVVRLCGSGSAVYGEFLSAGEAASAAASLREEGLWAVDCFTMTAIEGPEWM
jgi:4-diphosphocytidyl-2-C-methyl-D-erythritol kinase